MRAAMDRRPGQAVMRSRRKMALMLLVFFALVAIGITMQVMEIGTPGMAWYVYE